MLDIVVELLWWAIGTTGVLIAIAISFWWRVTTYERDVYRIIVGKYKLRGVYNDELIAKQWWCNKTVGQAASTVMLQYYSDIDENPDVWRETNN